MELKIEELKNTGLNTDLPIVEKSDYHSNLFSAVGEDILGASSPLDNLKIIFPDGKGRKEKALEYGLPERQFNRNFDTYSCVLYTIAKAICYNLYESYGIKTTVAEMFNAFYAKVVPGKGTSIRLGMESFRTKGWVEDHEYPFTTITTALEFFRKPPTPIQVMAAGKLTEWDFHWEVIPRNLRAIKEQYKKTPVVLTGYAWAQNPDYGVYYDNNRRANHAFLGIEGLDNGNNLIDDTYPSGGDKYREILKKEDMFKELHKDFSYASAHACWVTPKDTNSLLIKILNMLKKVSRDIHGGLWFIKDGKKQKIENGFQGFAALVDELGIDPKNNNLTNDQLSLLTDHSFFGK